MKSIIKSILFICVIQLAFSQVNTTNIQCPNAFRHIEYYENVFNGAGGDEQGMVVIESPSWVQVEIEMNEYWSNDVIISGIPLITGNYQIIVGIVDFNFWIDETALTDVIILNLNVQYPSCEDPESCNYDSTPCLGTNSCNCLYDVMCYVDPCEVTTCDNYPNAECVADYCDGCFAHYFVDGIEVECNEPPTCYSDDDCPNSSLCISSTIDCNMLESPGFCVEQTDYLCNESYIPVCGCDGNNYSNPCEANYMSFMGIDYFGECNESNPQIGDDCIDFNGNYGYLDCTLICVPNAIYENWLGDAICDEGWGPQFNCHEFGFDCGDCNSNWDGSDPLEFCELFTEYFEYCDPLYDTNGDGVLNVLDIIEVINYILYSDELSCSIDYNNDGSMNVLDIVIMVNIILGIEE